MSDILELIERAQAGDRQAEAEIFEVYLANDNKLLKRHFPRDWRISRDDAIQEGLIGLVEAIRGYKPARGTWEPYVARCIYARASRHRASERNYAENQGGQLVEPSAPEDGAEPPALPSLDCLSERERLIVEMRFGLLGTGEMSCAEIAEKMDLSKRSVEVALKSALERLRLIASDQ